jgi:hypothetical protein
MENNIQQQQEATIIRDVYNDDYWLKTYGVSSEELKETGDIGLPEKIIQANAKNHNFPN